MSDLRLPALPLFWT